MSVEGPWAYCCWLPTQTANRQTLSSVSVGCLLSSTNQQGLQMSPFCTENSCSTLPEGKTSTRTTSHQYILFIYDCAQAFCTLFFGTLNSGPQPLMPTFQNWISHNGATKLSCVSFLLLVSHNLQKNGKLTLMLYSVCQLLIICSSAQVYHWYLPLCQLFKGNSCLPLASASVPSVKRAVSLTCEWTILDLERLYTNAAPPISLSRSTLSSEIMKMKWKLNRQWKGIMLNM